MNEEIVERTLRLASYAKINYTLDVLNVRPDGFHNMASVMQAISLCDLLILRAEETPGVRLECSAAGIPCDETNLAYRAAAAILAEAGGERGVSILLEKRVPSQAGLGGGSSNAAYTLMGVNRLLELGLDDAALARIAATLGSDVPFFITGGTAMAHGRGERIEPLPDGPPLWLVVVKPEENVSTPWAYGALDAIPDRTSARATRRLKETMEQEGPEMMLRRLANDFEAVVYERYLPVALLRDDLLMARASAALLCGSGSAVFGVMPSREAAEAAARSLRAKYGSVHVCRTLSRAESRSLAVSE